MKSHPTATVEKWVTGGLCGESGIPIPNRGSGNSAWDINSRVLLANESQHRASIRSRGGKSGEDGALRDEECSGSGTFGI